MHLVQIIWTIAKKGIPSLSWQIISQEPKGGFYFGKEGGILNAIAGSFYLAVSATLLAFVISLPVALFMNIYLIKYQRLLIGIRFFLDVLWGVPSIVYGAFGFTLLMYLGYRNSLGAGIVTVAAMITPIMIRAMDEVLKTIPIGLQEASYALVQQKQKQHIKYFSKKHYLVLQLQFYLRLAEESAMQLQYYLPQVILIMCRIVLVNQQQHCHLQYFFS